MVEYLKAIFLGIVEGITEWLPISSTGHLILLEQFLQFNTDVLGKELAEHTHGKFCLCVYDVQLQLINLSTQRRRAENCCSVILYEYKGNAWQTEYIWLCFCIMVAGICGGENIYIVSTFFQSCCEGADGSGNPVQLRKEGV